MSTPLTSMGPGSLWCGRYRHYRRGGRAGFQRRRLLRTPDKHTGDDNADDPGNDHGAIRDNNTDGHNTRSNANANNSFIHSDSHRLKNTNNYDHANNDADAHPYSYPNPNHTNHS